MTHHGVIETSFTENEYQAVCSCGWGGNVWPTEADAHKELKDHYASP